MTEYEKIAQPLREVLKGTTPINSPSTWLEHEKMMCPLCPGTQKPHWISRCLKLWASTPEGREFFGTANAAERVRQAMEQNGVPIRTIEQMYMAADVACAQSNTFTGAELMQIVEEVGDLSLDDDAGCFISTVNAICAGVGEVMMIAEDRC